MDNTNTISRQKLQEQIVKELIDLDLKTILLKGRKKPKPKTE